MEQGVRHIHMTPIKTILFDFGGVLGSGAHDWSGTLLPVVDAADLSVGEMEGLWYRRWPSLAVGASDLSALWSDVSQASPRHTDPSVLADVFYSAITANEDAFRLARDLKTQGLRLAIVSNESRGGMDVKIRKFSLADIFEKVYCSAVMGFAKPDPMFFSYILHDLALEPHEVVLLDNEAKNIAAAEELGIRAFLFRNAAQSRIALEQVLGRSLYR